MATREQLDNFITATADPSDVDVSAGSLWSPSPTDLDSIFGIWTTARTNAARTSLNNALGLSEVVPVTPIDRAFRFQEWWGNEGQFVPKHILREIGVNNPGRTERSLELEERRSRAEGVKSFLGIKPKGDPLRAIETPITGQKIDVVTGATVKLTDVEKQAEEVEAKLRALSLDDLNAIRETIIESPLDFTAETSQMVDKEIGVKKHLPRVIEAISEKPMLIVWGTPLFDTFLGNIPGRTNAFDKLFNVEPGAVKNAIEALSRAREMILAEDPRLTTRMALGLGDTSAELIKFALLPDPSKLRVFSKLSKATKAAIGVGSRAGLVELLKAPADQETIDARMETVTKALAIGALTGAVLSKIVTFVQEIPLRRQAAAIVKKFPQIKQNEAVEIVRAIRENELIALTIKPPIAPARRIAPTGFRLGMAEIEKGAEFGKGIAGRTARATLKGGQAIAKAVAKIAETKAVIPTKVVTPKEAGPFGPGFEGKGEVPFRVVSGPPQVRRSIQAKENAVARLKTRLAEQKAKNNLTLAKKTQAEVLKREKDIETLRARHEVKLTRSKAEAAAKIDKILRTKEFKEELRTDALSMVMAIPKDQRANFMNRAFKVKTPRGVQKLALEIQEGVGKFERREEIRGVKDAFKAIDVKKMPEPQRSKMIELKDSVDLKKLSEAKEGELLSLEKHVQRVAIDLSGELSALDKAGGQTAEGLVPNPVIDELNRLSQMNINDMETEDIRLLGQAIRSVAHEAEQKSKLLVGRGLKPLTVDDAAKRTVSEIVPTRAGRKRAEALEAGKPVTVPAGTLGRARKLPRRALDAELHLDRLIEVSTSPAREATVKLLDTELHTGHRRVAEFTDSIATKSEARFEELGFTDFKQIDDKVTVTLGGKKIKLSQDYLVELELHFRSPDNLKAIMKTKGWEIDGLDLKIDYPRAMTPLDRVRELNTALDSVRNNPMLSGLADWTHSINPEMASEIEETFLLLRGYPPQMVENYTPRPRSLPKRIGGKTQPSTPIEGLGPFQPRSGGTQRLKLKKWSRTFQQQVEIVAFLRGMAVPLRNARIIVEGDAWQTGMENAGRAEDARAIRTMLQRIQQTPTSESLVEQTGRHFQRAVGVTGLGFRVSSGGTAALSYPVYGAEASLRAMTTTIPKLVSQDYLEKMWADSAVLKMRNRGQSINTELSIASSVDSFSLMFLGKPSKLSTKSFVFVKKGDTQAISNGHRVAVNEVLTTKRNGKNVDVFEWDGRNVADLPEMKTEFEAGYPVDKKVRFASARRAEFLVRRTQPMGDTLDKSAILSSPSIVTRTFFGTFRTALNAMYNAGVTGTNDFAKSKKTPADFAKLAKVYGAIGASALAVALWKKGFRWARNTSIRKVKDGIFGTFTFDETADLKTSEEIMDELFADTIKNVGNISTPLMVVVQAAEIIGDQIKGDGYNWNREILDNPALEMAQNGIVELATTWGKAIAAVGKLDEFVVATEDRPLSQKDIEFNKQIRNELITALGNVTRTTLDVGVRIGKIPVVAPFQEWIKPALRESRIKIIREVTPKDMAEPREFATTVAKLYALESQLAKDSKSRRLTDDEETTLALTRGFKSLADATADQIKNISDQGDRKDAFDSFVIRMESILDRLREI